MTMTVPSDTPPANQTHARPSRRLARQLALQMLFQNEFQDQNPSWQEKFWASQSASPEVQTFTSGIFLGVITNQSEIDRIIRDFAIDWSLKRMPVVDRNILRCSIYELLWEPDIPAMVTINEAVELAKLFADDEARRFVNGLLDHVLRAEPRLAVKRNQIQSRNPATEISEPSSSS
ncbi:MAG TPA: transcription antitermination factor NusB [Nitrospirales bacterium]|nr:transcription antitermination factor NusB [Nitrospiraceae bacterium]HNP27672.1 transcription antitermination factor NusB [Nitrospirales bacterium]